MQVLLYLHCNCINRAINRTSKKIYTRILFQRTTLVRASFILLSVSVFCRQFFFDQFHPSLFQKKLKCRFIWNIIIFFLSFKIDVAHTESYLSVSTALIFNFFIIYIAHTESYLSVSTALIFLKKLIIYIAHTESCLSLLAALIFFYFFYNLHCAYRVILVCINSTYLKKKL